MIRNGRPALVIAFAVGRDVADLLLRTRKAGLALISPLTGDAQALHILTAALPVLYNVIRDGENNDRSEAVHGGDALEQDDLRLLDRAARLWKCSRTDVLRRMLRGEKLPKR